MLFPEKYKTSKAVGMVGFQLLFALDFLIACASLSEDPSIIEEKCTWKSQSKFCQFVKRAEGSNKEALRRLNGPLAREGKKKLTEANQLVTEVVKNTNEASTKLMEAFDEEITALIFVKNDCSDLRKELHNEPDKQEGLEETCRFVTDTIGSAVVNILKAIIEAEGDLKQREDARKAFQELEHDMLTLW
ncbi:hypothetical protein Q1695_004144 [Nippostrongylus brasiliensis]|nr:hypothetical protein Q1695_004144 [Nippostrongylus brasiliensis]